MIRDAIAAGLVVALGGCQPDPVNPLAVPPMPPAVPPAGPAVRSSLDELEQLRTHYAAAADRERPAVYSPDATPAYVARLLSADLAARRALATLEAGHRPLPPADVQRARDALGYLSALLNEAGDHD